MRSNEEVLMFLRIAVPFIFIFVPLLAIGGVYIFFRDGGFDNDKGLSSFIILELFCLGSLIYAYLVGKKMLGWFSEK